MTSRANDHRPSTTNRLQWHAVIMAGGDGERLRPLTGPHLPKPLLPLRGGGTLLSAAIARAQTLVPRGRIWIVTTAAYKQLLQRAAPRALRPRLVVEPSVRGTATCIALMTHRIARSDAQAGLIIMPSDHWIGSLRAFRSTMQQAQQHAEQHPTSLLCVGIAPTKPHTGYGYLHYQGRRVTRFAEKPSAALAASWIKRGRFLWNGGMFVGRVAAFERAFARCVPSLARAERFHGAMDRHYARLPARSFDRDVLERYDDIAVVRAQFAWDDVGSWNAWPLLRQILDVPRAFRRAGSRGA